MRKWRKATTLTALAATAALLAAGCSSSSGSSGSGGSKAPIKLMVETTMTPAASLGGLSFPYAAIGVQAAAAAYNKKGGIDGHQIHIDVCDNKGSPDQSAVCGRKAKSNGDIAVVGSWDIYGGPSITPVLEAEGIPQVGGIAFSTAEVSNPQSFTIDTSAVLGPFATAGVMHLQGCKNAVVLIPANTALTGDASGLQKIAHADGYTLHTINIPTNQADITPEVSSTLSLHPDCWTYLGDAQLNVKLIAGLRQAGYKGKIFAGEGSILPPFLKTLGKLGDGIIGTSSVLGLTASDPGVTTFRDQVTAYEGASAAAGDLNEFSQNGWSAIQLVYKALAGSGNYTSAQIVKKIPTMCDVNVGNYYPHINFCKPIVKSTIYPHVYNDYGRYDIAQNGAYVPTDNQWHDFSYTIPTS